MGAVNRCWKCGKTMIAHSGPQDIPPIRRKPITGPLDAPLEALVLDDESKAAAPPEMRRGSPFTANSATLRVAGPIQRAEEEVPRPRRPRTFESQVASKIAAVASMVLALVAIGVSNAVPIAGVFLSVVVIGFGTWGLFGPRRGIAIFGLILGCIALAWGGFGTAVQIYELMYGIHPFTTSLPPPPPPPGF